MVLRDTFDWGVLCVILGVTGIACYFDKRESRIPNRLLLLGGFVEILFSMFLVVYRQDWWYIPEIIVRSVLFFFLLWPVYQIGGLGAGDCKLLLFIGMFLPIKISIFIYISSMVLAAGIGVARNAIRIVFLKISPVSGIHFSFYIFAVLLALIICLSVIQ